VSADVRPSVQVSRENIVRVTSGELITGPLISGELRAAHSATVRAEVGGIVLDVRVEEGQRISRGDLLGRIESQTLEDVRDSARSAVRSADAALELARIEVRRNEELVAAGAIAQRDLDQARANLAGAEAQLANARANLFAAEEELGDTILRGPLSGVISRRAVAAGDVVSAGTELFTVIDPRSMRLEASVSSEEIGHLRIGSSVRFTIAGYERAFQGRIDRITPEADPVTRQITIYVVIPNIAEHLVVGLFAEGRVVSNSGVGAIVPIDAVNAEDTLPWVLRVRGGRAERVVVSIALRDELTERVLLSSGVEEGDILLRGTDQAITPGSPVDLSL
jgi:RND family efflux transporter MFP subunit